MANKFSNDITSFWTRLQGQDRARTSDSLIVLNSPETNKERDLKQKIQSISQYVRTKNWNRRHIEYFDEYRRMDSTFPIIHSALDIYAEELLHKDTDGNIFSIKTDNLDVKKELEELFFKVLNMNSEGYKIARGMCKFGNAYYYLITRPKDGVTGLTNLPPEGIIREQMFDPNNLEAYRFMWQNGGGAGMFEPWELVHWKNGEDIEVYPYGVSILRSVVETWRRVVLMREALVIYRLNKAPQRFLFMIDTTGLGSDDSLRFVDQMKKSLEKKPLVNPNTGEIDFKWNPLSVSENLYIPTFEGSQNEVRVLDGASNLDAIEDYKIVKDDIYTGLKIPKSFLTAEADLSNKASLVEEDIRFAKTIQRIQSDFAEGLVHVAIVHLYLKGYSQSEIESFVIEMNTPSLASEKRRNDIVAQRIEIAKGAWDYNNPGLNLMSYKQVCSDILKFTDAEIQQSIKSQFAEKKLFWRLSKIYAEGTYQEPENEVLQSELKKMNGGKLEPSSSFDALEFESSRFMESSGDVTSLVRKAVDREIEELIGGRVNMKPSSKQITLLTESMPNSMLKNILKSKKDFK